MHCVIFVWFRAPLGGLHSNVKETVRSLLKSEHSVTVVCRPGPFAKSLKQEGCHVVHSEYQDLLSDLPPILNALAETPPTLVHVHPGLARQFGRVVADIFGVPVFSSYHGKWFDSIDKFSWGIERIIGVSPAICDAISEIAPEARDRIVMIPNATRAAQSKLAMHSPKTGVPRVVVASRFDVDKQEVTSLLCEAWSVQKELGIALKWDIAGTGTAIRELEEAARVLEPCAQSEVRFHGWLGETELMALYEDASFSVAPGRSAIDAMGRGLLTVALGSFGCFGLVTAENFEDAAYGNFGGFGLSESVGPEVFLRQIEAMASDPIALQEARAAIVERVNQTLDQDYWDQVLIDLYQEASSSYEQQKRQRSAVELEIEECP